MNHPYQEVEVLWLAENEYDPGASLKVHTHQEYYQIYYAVEGDASFFVDGEYYAMTKNTFVFACPGVPHGISSVGGTTGKSLRILEVKFAVLQGELAGELHQLAHVSQGTDALEAIINQAFLEAIQKDLYSEKIVEHLLSTLLYLIIRLHKNFQQSLAQEFMQPKAATQIRTYLNQHFAEDISLDYLALVIGYSKNYLCRIFREDTGITINYYLNQVRIDKAVALLANTDLDLAEIGRAVGYNSVYHFIKTFKKMVGIPPGSYRRKELVGSDLVCEQVHGISTMMRAGVTILKSDEEKDVSSS